MFELQIRNNSNAVQHSFKSGEEFNGMTMMGAQIIIRPNMSVEVKVSFIFNNRDYLLALADFESMIERGITIVEHLYSNEEPQRFTRLTTSHMLANPEQCWYGTHATDDDETKQARWVVSYPSGSMHVCDTCLEHLYN